MAKNLFICACMVIISISLGYSVWANLGLTGFESSITAMSFLVIQLVGYLFVWKAIVHRALISRIHDLALAEAENANGVDRISNELAGLRKTIKTVTRSELEPLVRELEVISSLVKQLAEGTSAVEARVTALEDAPVVAAPAPQKVVAKASEKKVARKSAPSTEANKANEPDASEWLGEIPADQPVSEIDELTSDNSPILKALKDAVDKNQVDLYLQPIVTLPQRKPKFYEALSRIRDANGELIRPAQFMRSAKKAGTMPVLDKMLLVRAIQVLRRLLLRKSDAVVVCNISAASLADSSFFNDFRKLLSAKPDLADHLIFEFDQATVFNMDTLEEESLRSLKNLGFRFAIDNVTDLSMDFLKLVSLGFHYVKASSQVLLAAKKTGVNEIHAEDFSRFLSRNGLQLIVDHVESESEIVELLDFDISLGQGFLFAAPREVKPDVISNQSRRAHDDKLAS
ncbi:MAG: EAL domain-containing protein [Hyphomicrobiales bacterium]